MIKMLLNVVFNYINDIVNIINIINFGICIFTNI